MKIISALFFLICIYSYSQKIDGYKYAYVPILQYEDGSIDSWGISNQTSNFLKNEGIIVLNDYDVNNLSNINPCEIITFGITHTNITIGTNRVTFKYYNCNGELGSFWGSAQALSLRADYRNATKKALKWLKKDMIGTYKFDPNKTPIYFSNVSKYNGGNIDFNDEDSIRDYFIKNGNNGIEGIWNYSSNDNSEYKLAIIKNDYDYSAYIVEGSGFWKPSELKAKFEPAAVNTVFTIKWTMGDKKTTIKSVATIENNGIIKFTLINPKDKSISTETLLYKVFPSIDNANISSKSTKSGEWTGNGSGIIISKSGYIITNNHVIDNADEVEVEFIVNNGVKKFNAEIVQVDKINDLAVIKIFDMDFDGLDDLPYNFKSRVSDVGTKVYAYGYPMALSIMGKEIKITDGIISSKTGFDGNISTYQITAPIQGGNSGGPLFDEKGNFIGINSSGLRKDLADNVGYTIKSSYILNLLDVLPNTIVLPSNTKLEALPLTEQIKEISKYVVLIKVK